MEQKNQATDLPSRLLLREPNRAMESQNRRSNALRQLAKGEAQLIEEADLTLFQHGQSIYIVMAQLIIEAGKGQHRTVLDMVNSYAAQVAEVHAHG